MTIGLARRVAGAKPNGWTPNNRRARKENPVYQLRDSFNNIKISNHRTAANAGKAAAKHTRAVKRHNGEQSYCRFELRVDGEVVDLNDRDNDDALDFCRGLNGGAL